jgi:NAD(P)-dependent dehydrogenase (short-subunit alcohol dehydrogenase family)
MHGSTTTTRRVALVTGATHGIGREVALALARGGDRVIFIGRDAARARELLKTLNALQPGAGHGYLLADLSLRSEVASVGEAVALDTPRLDALVCCAGQLSLRAEWTAEGLERSFTLNYLSRFMLACRLLPSLCRSPSGRVVLVGDAGRHGDTLDFDDLQHHRGQPGLDVWRRTQFANDLLATKLAARWRHTRIEITAAYPGLARTALWRNARGLPGVARIAATLLHGVCARSARAAADTPVYLARHPQAIGVSGKFFGPRRQAIVVPSQARRADRQTLLWQASEQLTRSYLPAAQWLEPVASRAAAASKEPVAPGAFGEPDGQPAITRA